MNSYAQQQERETISAASSKSEKSIERGPVERAGGGSPGEIRQRRLSEQMNRSSRVTSQIQLQQSLNNAPRVAAQAKLAESLSSRSKQTRPIQLIPADFSRSLAIGLPAGTRLFGTSPWATLLGTIRAYAALRDDQVAQRLTTLQLMERNITAWEAHHNVTTRNNLNQDERKKVTAIRDLRFLIGREGEEMSGVPGLPIADIETLYPLIAAHNLAFFQTLGTAVVAQGMSARRLRTLAEAVAGLAAADVVGLMQLAPHYNDAALATFGTTVHTNGIAVAVVTALAGGLHAARNTADIVQLALNAAAIGGGFDGGRAPAQIVTFVQNAAGVPIARLIAFMSHANPVTGSWTADDNFGGRANNTIGVGELIHLSAAIQPAGLTAANIGNLQWTLNAGGGNFTNPNPGAGTADFTNDGNTTALRLYLSIANAPYANVRVSTVDINVVAPNDALMVKDARPLRHTQGRWSVSFWGEVFLRPTNVSFRGIEWREGGGTVAANGFLSNFNGEMHTTGNWYGVGAGNSGQGNKVFTQDDVGGAKSPPFAIGYLIWPIEWQYRVGTGAATTFTTANHEMWADAAGRATVSKKGSGQFSKDAADPTVV